MSKKIEIDPSVDKKERANQIKSCLDEIDECLDNLENITAISSSRSKDLEAQIRKQKSFLKELKYSGKIRRRKRNG